MISCLVRNATVNFPHMQILTEDVDVAVNFNCSDLNITTPARDFDSHKKHNNAVLITFKYRWLALTEKIEILQDRCQI